MEQQQHDFEFTGSGPEYFRIWIVNLLLTVLTLGIYSAWAKVRRLQYFYRNTRLADCSFEYHGQPMAILKGRIIAFVMFMAYSVAGKLNPMLGLFAGMLIALAMPWFLARSLRFKLYNSSYRGLRFGFAGDDRGAYRAFLLFPILAGLSLYLLAPLAHQRMKQYQHGNSRFGATSFSFDATAGRFYVIYLITLGLLLCIPFLFWGLTAVHLPRLIPILPVAMLFIMAYPAVALPNLIWSSTALGEHRLFSKLELRRLLWISATNILGAVFTLGLFIPFADIRMMRYKLSRMGVVAQGELTEFAAGQERYDNATGEETAGMFDVDISL